MIYALCLIIGIVIGYFLYPTKISFNDEKEDETLESTYEKIKAKIEHTEDGTSEYNDSVNYSIGLPYQRFNLGLFERELEEDEPHELYLKNLETYKNKIDKTPDKYLKFCLQDAVSKEQYELAEYIKKVAIKRNFHI